MQYTRYVYTPHSGSEWDFAWESQPAQQNPYSISHLLGTATTQWLDNDM